MIPRGKAYDFANAINKFYKIPANTEQGFVELNCLDLRGMKFSLAINKNKNRTQSLVNEMEGKRNIANMEVYKEFEKERIAVCVKHAKKNEKGDLLKKQNRYGQEVYDMVSQENFEAEVKALREKDPYKEWFDKAAESYSKCYNELIDFNQVFHMIDEEDLSIDITSNIIDDLAWMINFK